MWVPNPRIRPAQHGTVALCSCHRCNAQPNATADPVATRISCRSTQRRSPLRGWGRGRGRGRGRGQRQRRGPWGHLVDEDARHGAATGEGVELVLYIIAIVPLVQLRGGAREPESVEQSVNPKTISGTIEGTHVQAHKARPQAAVLQGSSHSPAYD